MRSTIRRIKTLCILALVENGLHFYVCMFFDRIKYVLFYKWVYRAVFRHYGANVTYGRHGAFRCIPGNVTLNGIRKISLEDDVCIGEGVIIHCHHSGGNLVVKQGVRVNARSHIEVYSDVVIGSYALIAPNVLISSSNHYCGPLGKSGTRPSEASGTIDIGAGVWLGEGSTVLGGCAIGCNSVVGANAVVTTTLDSYVVAVGNPARVVKSLANS